MRLPCEHYGALYDPFAKGTFTEELTPTQDRLNLTPKTKAAKGTSTEKLTPKQDRLNPKPKTKAAKGTFTEELPLDDSAWVERHCASNMIMF